MVKETRRAKVVVAMVLFVGLLLPSTGCDQALLGEVAALSATYAGGVVEVATTHFLQSVWSVAEADTADSTALHDHEH